MSGAPRSRRSFGPVVLVGLAAAALTAVATARPAAEAVRVPRDVVLGEQPAADLPLASALSLVLLAAWGAALVLRGRVRRTALAVGLLAALGTVAALAVGARSLPEAVRAPYAAAGYAQVEVGLTAWYAAAWVGALLSAATLAAAVGLAPSWPEMGSRYDAPTGGGTGPAAATTAAAGTATAGSDEVDGARERELWRALDEGRDPTAGPS